MLANLMILHGLFHRAASFLISLCVWAAFAGLLTQASASAQAQGEPLNWQSAGEAYPAREGHTCLAFNGKLWVIGGGIYLHNDSTQGKSFELYPFNDVWSSDDGQVWHAAVTTNPFTKRAYHASAVFHGRMWVTGGLKIDFEAYDKYSGGSQNESLGDVWSSADGVNWTLENAAAFPMRYGHDCFVFQDKLWVTGQDTWCSGDGANWTQATGKMPSGRCLVMDDKLWVIRGRSVWRSVDGDQWTTVTTTATYPAYYGECVAHAGKLWVIGGGKNYNEVWWSADGATWTQATSEAEFPQRGGMACASFGDWLVLTGGENWAFRSLSSYSYLNDTWRSKDGITWQKLTSNGHWSERADQAAAVFNNKIWVTGGEQINGYYCYPDNYIGYARYHDVWSSTDGTDWRMESPAAPFAGRSGLASIAFNGRLWVIGGGQSPIDYGGQLFNDVWCSDNGSTWTRVTAQAPFTPRAGHLALVHDGKMWVIGGSGKSDVWCSANGTSWTQATAAAPFGSRSGFAGAVLNGRMWIIGNDVWWSTDGTSWTQATAAAPFAPRQGHMCLAANDKLWVIGGYNGNEYLSDIWCSSDGANWTQVTAAAPFGSRTGASAVAFDGRLWVLGGWIDFNYPTYYENDAWWSTDGAHWFQAGTSPLPNLNYYTTVSWGDRLWLISGIDYIMPNIFSDSSEVWWTRDGRTWTQAAVQAPFPARYNPGSVVYKNKLWVMGGYNIVDGGYDQINKLRDVWWSDDGITWTQATSQAPFYYGTDRGIYLADEQRMWSVTDYGVWWSTDGTSWTRTTANYLCGVLGGFIHDGELWVVGTDQTQGKALHLWKSTDGATWSPADGPLPMDWVVGDNCIACAGRVWSTQGTNVIWTTDGVNWNTASPSMQDYQYPYILWGPSLNSRGSSLKLAAVNHQLFLMLGLICNGYPGIVDQAWLAEPPQNGVKDWTLYEQ